MGLWYGLYIGVTIQMILQAVLIWRANWEELAQEAHDRIKKDH